MIFFFYGPNRFLARQELDRMQTAYLKKTGSDFGLDKVDGATLSVSGLRSVLQASPFLASSRLVIVRDFGQTKPTAAQVEQLVKEIPATTVAVFYDPDADQRTAYVKSMLKLARVVKFEPLATTALFSWIEQTASSVGGTISRSAAQKLVDAAGEDQWRLREELIKLTGYQAEVTAETIEAMVVPTLHQSVFVLVEAMMAGKARESISVYRDLLEEREHELKLLTMVIWQLRNVMMAKLAPPVSSDDLAKMTGLSPYVASKAQALAKHIDKNVLTNVFCQAAETEYRIKSGAEPGQRAVERLIIEIATQMQPSKR